ncbi:nucleolar protein 12-like [Ornithodoros turicata]|uniref:Nucleolar protein 12 n=1 Tax=Ornithodoros turicata TaxID=34597 RepID=A0A2R5LG35_9ACAR
MTKKKSHKQTQKINLIFDEKDRKDFLTGFSKRKTERKKKARDKIMLRAKEEKRILKAQKRKILQELLHGHVDPLPDATTKEVTAVEEPVTYDMPEHTVTVTALDSNALYGDVCVGNNTFDELDTVIADAGEIDAKKNKIRELEQKMAECSQAAIDKLHKKKNRSRRRKSKKKDD